MGGEVRRTGATKSSDAGITDLEKRFGFGQTSTERPKIRLDRMKNLRLYIVIQFLRTSRC